MKIIIIGGVAAGAKAAAKANRILKNEGDIIIYTDDEYISYSSCGLPYYIAGDFEDYRVLLVRSPEEFEKSGVKVRLKHRVLKILPDRKQVIISDLVTGRVFADDYDKLIIATGASARIPNIKNVHLPNVYTLRNIRDGIRLKEQVMSSNKAIIVGGGYIGIELLDAFVSRGLEVTLIHNRKHLLNRLDSEMSELVYEQLNMMSANRFEIIRGENIIEFQNPHHGMFYAKLESGQIINGDFAVLATGIRPNVELAVDAGIELGVTGAIKVDKHMQTNIADIYACGDCIEVNFMVNDTQGWFPLGSNANKEGRCAAINACGLEENFDGVLGSAVTKCLNLAVSLTGMGEEMARLNNIEPIAVTITKTDKVGYMPDVNNITLKLVADKQTGQILGGQAVGSKEADKRINALTGAILSKMTVNEFCQNDLTYSPPFSPTIDPLLNAAMLLRDKINAEKA